MPDMIPLDRLRAGEIAQIVSVVGRPEQVHRMKELGLHDGAEVSVIQSGSPCIIRLAGQTLCIRANELLRVLVRPAVTA
jgi:ferrous iron transport protein A